MSNPAFEVARGIGNNLSREFSRVNDENAIERILAEAKQSGKPEVLENAIGKIISQVSPERRQDAVQYLQHAYQNVEKREKLNRELQKEKKRDESAIAAGVTPGLEPSVQKEQLISQRKIQENKSKEKIGKDIKSSLVNAGYPEDTANLWQNQFQASPTGGQTDVIKQVNELIKRSAKGKGLIEGEEVSSSKPNIEIPGIDIERFSLDFPELREPLSRTSADLVKEETEHKKINSPLYSETINRLNTLDDEFTDIALLQEYNETPGALPTGLQKWNVDWETGDLRLKTLATPETQAYVKTIARMARKARDFFPGRVIMEIK